MLHVRALRRTFRRDVIQHIDPGAAAHFDQPFNFQHDQRFANHGTGYIQHLGDLALRRQAIARVIGRLDDEIAN